MNSTTRTLLPAHIALIIANLLFGVNFTLFQSIISSAINFQQLFYIRILFSALFFIPFILTRKTYRIDTEEFLRILTAMILIVFGKQYMMLWGADYTTPINSAIIANLAPVVTLTVAMLTTNEKAHPIKIIAISLATTALFLLIFSNGMPKQNAMAYGNILLLISTISAAINTIVIKPALKKVGVARTMGWYYIMALITTTPFFFNDFMAIDISTISNTIKIEIVWVVVLGTILPNYLLYYATQIAMPEHNASYYYLQPVAAAILLQIRGKSYINNITIIATILIFSALLLVIIDHYKVAREAKRE